MPGGIANKSFVREWDGFCKAMDSNDFLKLPRHSALPLKLISKCVSWAISSFIALLIAMRFDFLKPCSQICPCIVQAGFLDVFDRGCGRTLACAAHFFVV